VAEGASAGQGAAQAQVLAPALDQDFPAAPAAVAALDQDFPVARVEAAAQDRDSPAAPPVAVDQEGRVAATLVVRGLVRADRPGRAIPACLAA
jgi:hypothetical protein